MAVSFDIAAWHVWLALGLLLIIAEVIGTELVLLALGAAALATGLAAATADLGLNMQLLVYGIAAALFVPVFMTFYRRRFKATGTRALVGDGVWRDAEYTVVEYGGRHGIRIDGDFFPAASTEGDPLRAGELVRVLEMRGLTAIVERI